MKFKVGDRVISKRDCIPYYKKGDSGKIQYLSEKDCEIEFDIKYKDGYWWATFKEIEHHFVYDSPLYEALK